MDSELNTTACHTPNFGNQSSTALTFTRCKCEDIPLKRKRVESQRCLCPTPSYKSGSGPDSRLIWFSHLREHSVRRRDHGTRQTQNQRPARESHGCPTTAAATLVPRRGRRAAPVPPRRVLRYVHSFACGFVSLIRRPHVPLLIAVAFVRRIPIEK